MSYLTDARSFLEHRMEERQAKILKSAKAKFKRAVRKINICLFFKIKMNELPETVDEKKEKEGFRFSAQNLSQCWCRGNNERAAWVKFSASFQAERKFDVLISSMLSILTVRLSISLYNLLRFQLTSKIADAKDYVNMSYKWNPKFIPNMGKLLKEFEEKKRQVNDLTSGKSINTKNGKSGKSKKKKKINTFESDLSEEDVNFTKKLKTLKDLGIADEKSVPAPPKYVFNS